MLHSLASAPQLQGVWRFDPISFIIGVIFSAVIFGVLFLFRFQLRDGSGFDIRSLGPADRYGKRPVRRIEVKGRSGYNQPVVLTTNEWLQAQRHTDSYWLYVVWGCGQGQTPQLLDPIQNPAARLARQAQPIIKHYLIPADALSGSG